MNESAAQMASDALDRAFAALADPTRRAILARLARGEATVNELAEPFEMSQPAISKHLQVLERAGLVSATRDAQKRPRRLEAQPIREVAEWALSYREYWEDSYDRLDAYLAELQAEPKKPTKKEKPHGPQARHRRQPR